MTPPLLHGAGAVTPFGVGAPALLEAIFAGRTALHPAEGFPVAALAETPSDPLACALAAAREALGAVDPAEVQLVLATTKADLAGVVGRGEERGAPWRLAAKLAAALEVTRPPVALSCACISGLSALAWAGRHLRRRRARWVLVVGVDVLSDFVRAGFEALLALDPAPCRPFDASRRGLCLGEAAGALLLGLDPTDDPVALIGWGESNDANHVTGPSRTGAGLHLAAERALRRAEVAPAAVDYVHLHGTGTRYNDTAEALALSELFGGATPLASGTKAQTGHLLGAAGVIETLIVAEALRRGQAPYNVRLETSDVDPQLQLIRTAPAALPDPQVALKVGAGFGGLNAAVVLRKVA